VEKTLVIVKPDATQRGLIGEILSRFEKAGLKLIATKMVTPSKDLANKHYPIDREEFIRGMGHKTLENHQEENKDVTEIFGTEDPHKIGLQLQRWLVDFLVSGRVVAIVLEGENAIKKARDIAGHTVPAKADTGTIRGDHSDDSAVRANAEKRAIMNLVHASGDKAEADFEIGLWFTPDELQE